MGFMTAYKHLEKLCGEVMGDPRRLSAYIDEMEGKANGLRYVAGWERDLKRLKHYRWIRNQIVHDPDCCEETMCDEEDVQWLEDFYGRIMDQTDPLALYRRAIQARRTPVQRRPESRISSEAIRTDSVQPAVKGSRAGCGLLLLAAVGMIGLLCLLVV